MKNLKSTIKMWLIAASIITLLCGIIYGTVQQTYRSNANDPQYQIAEDAAIKISNGADAKMFVKTIPVEISKSLSAFINIYDEDRNVMAADGLLNGKVPSIPAGVFDYAKEHGENAITWMPQPNVRMAIVVQYFTGASKGFVVAGRSLKKTEERISILINQIMIGWIISLVLLSFIIGALNFIIKNEYSM